MDMKLGILILLNAALGAIFRGNTVFIESTQISSMFLFLSMIFSILSLVLNRFQTDKKDGFLVFMMSQERRHNGGSLLHLAKRLFNGGICRKQPPLRQHYSVNNNFIKS